MSYVVETKVPRSLVSSIMEFDELEDALSAIEHHFQTGGTEARITFGLLGFGPDVIRDPAP